jgi:hypothetical protein
MLPVSALPAIDPMVVPAHAEQPPERTTCGGSDSPDEGGSLPLLLELVPEARVATRAGAAREIVTCLVARDALSRPLRRALRPPRDVHPGPTSRRMRP